MAQTPATAFLAKHKVQYTEHEFDYVEHGGTSHSSASMGVPEHQVIKTLVMEDERGSPLIVLMHGDRKVSTKELARQAGAKRVAPCKPEVYPELLPARLRKAGPSRTDQLVRHLAQTSELRVVDLRAPLKTGLELMKAHAAIRAEVPGLEVDRYMADELAAAAELVSSGRLNASVSAELLHQTVREHLGKSVQFYGEEDGQRLFRKYAVQYLLLKTLDRDARKEILKERPSGEFLEMLNQVYAVTAVV